jgi:hypothetical protein
MDCLLSLPISTGTVLSVLARAHDGLESFEARVKDHCPVSGRASAVLVGPSGPGAGDF